MRVAVSWVISSKDSTSFRSAGQFAPASAATEAGPGAHPSRCVRPGQAPAGFKFGFGDAVIVANAVAG